MHEWEEEAEIEAKTKDYSDEVIPKRHATHARNFSLLSFSSELGYGGAFGFYL